MPLPIFIAKFDANRNLDYSRFGGSLTGTATGTITTTGGKLDMTAGGVKILNFNPTYTFSIGNEISIKCKYTPNYSGAPASIQYPFAASLSPYEESSRVHLYHHTNGELSFSGHCYVGNVGFNIRTAWNPTAGVEYEINAEMNFTTGVHRLFVNGVIIASTTGVTGTRMWGAGIMRVGADYTDANVANFFMRDLIVYNETQKTANYTPGYTITLPVADTWPTEAQTKTGVTFYQSDVLKTGTYDGSDRWTDLDATKVENNYAYKANSLTNNKTGTLNAISNTVANSELTGPETSQTLEAG